LTLSREEAGKVVDSTKGEDKSARPTVKRINEMSIAFQQAGILWAATEMEVFTKVSNGVDELASLARELGTELEVTDRLLTACCALGLLVQEGGRYSNPPDVERFLVKGKPTYHGDWALYHKSGYDQWKNLADNMRPPKGIYDRVREDPDVARELATSGYHSAIGAGRKFAREHDLSSRSLMLDVGGGSGVYSIMACQKYPDLHAIVCDFPTVLTVTDEFISEAGLTDRIQTQPLDYILDDFPSQADVILICGTLEPRTSEDHQLVIGKAFQALPPGGELILITNMLEADKSGPFEAVFSNLGNVMGPKPWGRIHTPTELTGFLTNAGFVDLVFNDFVPGTYRMVTAQKPT
jgi:hypothetical protein